MGSRNNVIAKKKGKKLTAHKVENLFLISFWHRSLYWSHDSPRLQLMGSQFSSYPLLYSVGDDWSTTYRSPWNHVIPPPPPPLPPPQKKNLPNHLGD